MLLGSLRVKSGERWDVSGGWRFAIYYAVLVAFDARYAIHDMDFFSSC